MKQMWRVVMGNAPGLKAEIAKLHATEQAKLALREFERAARGGTTASSSSDMTITAPSSPESSPGGSATKPDEIKFDLMGGSRGRGDSPTPQQQHAQTDRFDGGSESARNRRGGGGGGMFAWLTGVYKRDEPPSAQRERRGKGVDGPFTA